MIATGRKAAGTCRSLAIAAIGTALAACTAPREAAVKTLEKVTPAQLRLDAALLHKRIFAGHGTDFVLIRAKEWPVSFQSFAPIRVGVYPDGVSLTLVAKSDKESGIYLVPTSMDHSPSDTHGSKFQRLADGVYWYAFGD